jgi:hypothetical protein
MAISIKNINGLSAGAVDPYADILFHYSGEESTWYNATKAAGSASGSAVGNIASSSTHAINSTKSAFWNGINSYLSFASSGNFSQDEGGIGFWFRPTSIQNFGGLFYYNNGGGQIIVHTTASGRLRYIYITGVDTTIADGTGMAINNWYYITFMWKRATNNADVKVWNLADDLIMTSSNTSAPGSFTVTPSEFRIGETLANSTLGYVDNFVVTNSYSRDLHAIKENTSY